MERWVSGEMKPGEQENWISKACPPLSFLLLLRAENGMPFDFFFFKRREKHGQVE